MVEHGWPLCEMLRMGVRDWAPWFEAFEARRRAEAEAIKRANAG